MYVANGHRKPTAPALLHEPLGLLWIGGAGPCPPPEAPLRPVAYLIVAVLFGERDNVFDHPDPDVLDGLLLGDKPRAFSEFSQPTVYC